MTDKDKRPADAASDPAPEETKEQRRARRNAENAPRDHSGAVIEEPPTDVQQALSSARVDITNYDKPRTVKVPNPPPTDGRKALTSTERTKEVARDTAPVGGSDATAEDLGDAVDEQPPTGMPEPAGEAAHEPDPRPAREAAGLPPVVPRDQQPAAGTTRRKSREQLAKEAAGEPPTKGTVRSAGDAERLADGDDAKQKGK